MLLGIRPRWSPSPVKRAIHGLYVKTRRIKVVATPLHHLVVIGVVRVADRLKETIVARNTSNIVGRACPATRKQMWIPRPRGSRNDGFQDDFVFPAVAEIVVVNESVFGATQNVGQSSRLLVSILDREEPSSCASLSCLRNAEAVHVAIGPAHHDLQDKMNPLQRGVALHLKPPPDWWTRMKKRHLQLVDGFTSPCLFACCPHQFLPDA